jgi:hypothetical protein
MAPAIAFPRSFRTRCGTAAPNPDSPHIPHDKVTKMTDSYHKTKMTDSYHKTLSEGHHHPPAESFKSSLNFSCECASDEDK